MTTFIHQQAKDVAIPYKKLKGLKEHFYGVLEGESERINEHLTPQDCETFYLQYGGESSNNVKDRMMSTLKEIMRNDNHNEVLALSHSGACFNFLRAIQDPLKGSKKWELSGKFP